MKVPGLGWIRHAADILGTRLDPGIPVLLYHRVADLPFDPQWLAVRPEHFEQQMRVLREKFFPLSLRQLLDALAVGKIPRRAVMVTFDDGYADNFLQAKPILEKFDIPSAIFITTGNLGGKSEFWWDELEKFLFAPALLPETLALNISGETFTQRLAERAFSQKLPDAWNVLNDKTPTERHRLYRELAKILTELLPEERETVLNSLSRWSGCSRAPRASHVSLTAEELADFGKSGLVEFGSHTVRHPKLSRLTAAAQASEIHESRRTLEDILGREITAFSYPFGGHLAYSRETIAILKSAGFRCAFSAMPYRVRRDGDAFQLPRCFVRDWDGDQFARELSAFASFKPWMKMYEHEGEDAKIAN